MLFEQTTAKLSANQTEQMHNFKKIHKKNMIKKNTIDCS